ncbi:MULTISPECIES: hypothetical protein [unclassified Chryseobacterium]|uniref:hypothetical protein n=1 Tax=unclassified Chryseobacterium TaxID=2593645 RepID=UPI001B659FAE|nr:MULTISPECIES: hypothetical protein [unclassified Chryseobacterium]MBP1163770.1 putative lipoprotein YbaY [Chryseobacterium sp. PvR013]MDR4894073.1 hypothetical protein [Chryseobacterium sp. CFS7]
MRNHLLLFAAAGTLILSSCTKPQSKSTTDNPTSAVSASETSSENIKLEFSGTENFTIKNPKLKVSLYGMDEKLADAPASLITEKEFEQKSVPFTIDLPVPKDAESKINPKPAGPAKYYVTISWDSDGNGKADEKGDIFIDYDKQFPNVKLNNETQKIYLKVLK